MKNNSLKSLLILSIFTNFMKHATQQAGPTQPNPSSLPYSCKVFAAPCACKVVNMGTLPGYCFPPQQQIKFKSPGVIDRAALAVIDPSALACDCKSDVLSEEEVITEVIKKYYDKSAKVPGTDRLIADDIKKWQKSHAALESIHKILGDDPKDFNPANIQQERKNLMIAMREEPSLRLFYASPGGACTFIGQKCGCKDGKTLGVCSIGRYWMKDVLMCYCE